MKDKGRCPVGYQYHEDEFYSLKIKTWHVRNGDLGNTWNISYISVGDFRKYDDH